MVQNLGRIPIGTVIPIHFPSYDSNGASVALSGLAVTDVEIYKGVSVTQRASDAGVALLDTDGIDIDGIVGANGISIDTGDNTDAGFYAAASMYNVWIASVTIDGQTVNIHLATFTLVPAESTAGVPIVDQATAAAVLAMLDDPRAEPGQGAPPVNADMATKVDYLFKAWRNKRTQTATTESIFNDAGSTVDQKRTDSDDGTTLTKGEVSSGP